MSGGQNDSLRSSGGQKRLRAATASLAVFVLLFAASVAVAASQGPVEEEGRYIVVLRDSIEHPDAVGQEHVDRNGGHLGFVYRHGPIGYSATLPADAVEALLRDPRVRDVRVDREVVVPAVQSIPTGVKRVFASTNKALQIDETGNYATNADVAVIDTGVDTKHPDIKVVARTYCNEVEKKSTCTNETGTDEVGHGTHVAGTIAAIDNTQGVVGVAPGARLWAVKVLDPKAFESELTAGVNWVTERAKEIEVANMSIGCETLPCTLPTMGEAITKSVEAGVVYVAAAGNNAGDAKNSTFGTNLSLITVSAIADYDGISGEKAEALWSPSCKATKAKEGEVKYGTDDNLASFSNYGKEIEIAAPGVCILSTLPGGLYGTDSGTSMAAPHVAGAAAILAALSNPNSKADVENIRGTLIKNGNLNWKDTSGDGVQEKLLDVSNETVFK